MSAEVQNQNSFNLHNNKEDDNLSEELKLLSQEFEPLKNKKSHFNGGEWDHDCDAPLGKKFKLLNDFKVYFESVDKSRKNLDVIFKVLKNPDEIKKNHPGSSTKEPEDTPSLMPGPVIMGGGGGASGFGRDNEVVYLYWRNKHDYLYFTVKGDEVVGVDWYNAGE
ncbi:hypothetical protein HK099_007250 [Clydaea vesicula]|uniref:Uncharacterized protein n=1 Tax=Clydaea vesicula TaxID=447962 RepID=A0AAD5Y2T3_9FUNG|nr:hypothetical protein HK099_007250 [Clydaea vesicula]